MFSSVATDFGPSTINLPMPMCLLVRTTDPVLCKWLSIETLVVNNMVGWFVFLGLTALGLYRAVPQRGRMKRENTTREKKY